MTLWTPRPRPILTPRPRVCRRCGRPRRAPPATRLVERGRRFNAAAAALCCCCVDEHLKPTSDVSTGSWTSPAWSVIEEEPYNDSDKIQTSTATDTCKVHLSDPVGTPDSTMTHRVRYRAYRSGYEQNLQVHLYQGTTLIRSGSMHGLTGTAAEYNFTLTAGEAGNITDYTDLRLWFVSGSLSTPPVTEDLHPASSITNVNWTVSDGISQPHQALSPASGVYMRGNEALSSGDLEVEWAEPSFPLSIDTSGTHRLLTSEVSASPGKAYTALIRKSGSTIVTYNAAAQEDIDYTLSSSERSALGNYVGLRFRANIVYDLLSGNCDLDYAILRIPYLQTFTVFVTWAELEILCP